MLVTITKRMNITPAEQIPTLASNERDAEGESMPFAGMVLFKEFEDGVEDGDEDRVAEIRDDAAGSDRSNTLLVKVAKLVACDDIVDAVMANDIDEALEAVDVVLSDSPLVVFSTT